MEAALRSHAAVREALVVAQGEAGGDRRLVAYIVLAGTSSSSPSLAMTELRGFLVARLPEYLVPSVFVPLAALPRTASGKLDRRALPAPEQTALDTESYVAPRTPREEEILAGIWRSLLAVERIGVDDDFFALGGHSLLATRVISRLREMLGVEVPLAAVFKDTHGGGLGTAAERTRGSLTDHASDPCSRGAANKGAAQASRGDPPGRGRPPLRTRQALDPGAGRGRPDRRAGWRPCRVSMTGQGLDGDVECFAPPPERNPLDELLDPIVAPRAPRPEDTAIGVPETLEDLILGVVISVVIVQIIGISKDHPKARESTREEPVVPAGSARRGRSSSSRTSDPPRCRTATPGVP